jgi:hypothetical protein
MTRIDQYLDKSQEIILLSKSQEIEAVRVLLKATENKRNKVRDILETKPKHSPENLEDDLVFLLGMVKGLNWVLRLPARSENYIKNLK